MEPLTNIFRKAHSRPPQGDILHHLHPDRRRRHRELLPTLPPARGMFLEHRGHGSHRG
jgi:hypothetical protein